MSERALKLRITGTVQGVGYRAFTQDTARRLGIAGWVRNCADGSVEAVAHGPGEALGALLEQLRKGPGEAMVDSLDVHSTDAAAATDSPPDAYRF